MQSIITVICNLLKLKFNLVYKYFSVIGLISVLIFLNLFIDFFPLLVCVLITFNLCILLFSISNYLPYIFSKTLYLLFGIFICILRIVLICVCCLCLSLIYFHSSVLHCSIYLSMYVILLWRVLFPQKVTNWFNNSKSKNPKILTNFKFYPQKIDV